MKENKIKMSTDIDHGTVYLRKRGKSIIKKEGYTQWKNTKS